MSTLQEGSEVNKEIHVLGAYVHGALTALHTLGLVYNLRRRNWWDVVAHAVGVVYDARSVAHHAREAR
jgi:hypothetical protein